MPRAGQRKCRHCNKLYTPDHRNRFHQNFCSDPACKKASKTESQRRWRRSPKGRDYFKGQTQAQRVKQWRLKKPGYWKTHTRKPRKPSVALQDLSISQTISNQGVDANGTGMSSLGALQALLFAQDDVLNGLILKLIGPVPDGTLQDHIDFYRHALILSARQVRGQGTHHADHQTPALAPTATPTADSVQLDRSAPGTG